MPHWARYHTSGLLMLRRRQRQSFAEWEATKAAEREEQREGWANYSSAIYQSRKGLAGVPRPDEWRFAAGSSAAGACGRLERECCRAPIRTRIARTYISIDAGAQHEAPRIVCHRPPQVEAERAQQRAQQRQVCETTIEAHRTTAAVRLTVANHGAARVSPEPSDGCQVLHVLALRVTPCVLRCAC